ncbi:hypothetical protein D3C79_646680 [compost metagenome]
MLVFDRDRHGPVGVEQPLWPSALDLVGTHDIFEDVTRVDGVVVEFDRHALAPLDPVVDRRGVHLPDLALVRAAYGGSFSILKTSGEDVRLCRITFLDIADHLVDVAPHMHRKPQVFPGAGQANVLQLHQLDVVERTERRLTINATRVFGHQIQKTSCLGVVTRCVNKQGFLRLVIERDVQIPVGIDNFFGLSPPNQRLSPSYRNNGIGLLIDREVLQYLSTPIQTLRPLRCPVFGRDVIRHGADFGVWVQPENHLGIVTVSELLGEVRLLNFPADLFLTHVANDCPPVSTLLIEVSHLVVGLLVSDVRHELGITKGRIHPCQPADELERNGRALVLIMNGSNFELG